MNKFIMAIGLVLMSSALYGMEEDSRTFSRKRPLSPLPQSDLHEDKRIHLSLQILTSNDLENLDINALLCFKRRPSNLLNVLNHPERYFPPYFLNHGPLSEAAHLNFQKGEAVYDWELVSPARDRKAIKYLRRASALGHPDAPYYLACLLEDERIDFEGDGEEESTAIGNDYFLAALRGNAEAAFLMGTFYEKGDYNFQPSPSHALFFFLLSGVRNHPTALLKLAEQQERGIQEILAPNPLAASKIYLRAALKNEPHALVKMSSFYRNGQFGFPHHLTTAYQYLEIADFFESPEAPYILGQLHESGLQEDGRLIVPPSFERAICYYQEAVDRGYSKAHFAIGRLYEMRPNSNASDVILALTHYIDGASVQDPDALNALGRIFYQGLNGSFKNIPSAIQKLEAASTLNHPEATYMLSVIYRQSEGFQDVTKSQKFLDKACQLGHPPAKLEKAQQLDNKDQKTLEEVKEMLLLYKDASQTESLAAFRLHEIAQGGLFGLSPNVQLSYSFLQRASTLGHPIAQEVLSRITLPSTLED